VDVKKRALPGIVAVVVLVLAVCVGSYFTGDAYSPMKSNLYPYASATSATPPLQSGLSQSQTKSNLYANPYADLYDVDFEYTISEVPGPRMQDPPLRIGAQDVDINSQGNAYIADWGNREIHVFDPDGEYLFSFSDPEFPLPSHLAIDSTDRVIVSSWPSLRGDKAISIFDSTGQLLSRIYGRPQSAYAAAVFSRPHGVAVDKDDNIYVADSRGGKIIVFTPDGTLLKRLDNVAFDLDVDSNGHIFTVNGNMWVSILDQAGNEIDRLDGDFDWPWGICIDSEDKIIVTDHQSSSIQVHSRYNPTPFAADAGGRLLFRFGQPGSDIGVGGIRDSDDRVPFLLNNPKGCATSGNKIYIADSSNRKIKVFSWA